MKAKLIQCLILIMILFVFVACSTINPYTGEKQTSKAVKGAGIGAARVAVCGPGDQ